MAQLTGSGTGNGNNDGERTMKERPQCAVEGCERPAWIYFAGIWICGECMAEYDKKTKERSFNELEEVLGK